MKLVLAIAATLVGGALLWIYLPGLFVIVLIAAPMAVGFVVLGMIDKRGEARSEGRRVYVAGMFRPLGGADSDTD